MPRRRGIEATVGLAFALLVVATLAAFFITQRLKSSPNVLQGFSEQRFFSPNGDGIQDRAQISFSLERPDDVTAFVIGPGGDIVRELARDVPVAARRPFTVVWDGRNADGTMAADGRYVVRIRLRRLGRLLTVPQPLVLDTVPPRLRVSLSPRPRAGPVVIGGRGRGSVRVDAGRGVAPGISLLVYRTDRGAPRLLTRVAGPPDARSATWHGRAHHALAPAATYLVAVRAHDRAGNTASVPARLPPARGAPAPRVGVTVRYLSARGPRGPVAAGSRVAFSVDAGGRRYAWSVRRVGASKPVARGRSNARRLAVTAPGGGGLYELELVAAGHGYAVPFAVGALRARRVLVVVPTISWLGANPVDDDGDGFPDDLRAGTAAALDRPYAGDGLPPDLPGAVAPLLAALDRGHARYEVTSDLALARGEGPTLSGHRGVVLAGDSVWLPVGLRARLRRYVLRGGRVLELGVDSLRRTVDLRGDRLAHPSPPAAGDVFGTTLAPLRHGRVALSVVRDDLGLFAGTGPLTGFDAYEALRGVAADASLLAAADAPDGRPVVAAYGLGHGLVIRTGLPQWGERVRRGGAPARIMGRIWRTLSR